MFFNTKHLFCTQIFRNLIASSKPFSSTSWSISSSCHIVQNDRQFHTCGTLYSVNKQERNLGRTDWKSAIHEAEQIVMYPASFLSIRLLLSDELADIAPHFRKLKQKASNHPLLKIEKSLQYNGRSSMQAWGLIVVLFSKAAGHKIVDKTELDETAGVLNSQRALADASDMVRISHLIHKGLVNIYPDTNTETQTMQDLVFGNKIALLSGDYLLVNAWEVIANIRNSKLLELMSSAIRHMTEAELIGLRDKQNQPLPNPGLTEQDWMMRSVLSVGSLLGKTCQGALMLAGHEEKLQQSGYLFGQHLALAWQACFELESFTSPKETQSEVPFSLTSAPVILTLQQNEPLFEEINKGKDSVENVDYAKIYAAVLHGLGIEQTRQLLRHHAEKALQELELFEDSDARTALSNIIFAMGD